VFRDPPFYDEIGGNQINSTLITPFPFNNNEQHTIVSSSDDDNNPINNKQQLTLLSE
jgi:hypothetical protein